MYIYTNSTVLISDIGTSTTKTGYSTSLSPFSNNKTPPCLSHSQLTDLPLFLSNLPTYQSILLPLNSSFKEYRNRILENLIENNQSENILFVESNVADLFSYGKTTGIVIRLSESINVSAVVDGLVRIQREKKFGGSDITKMFVNKFYNGDLNFFEKARIMKEDVLTLKNNESTVYNEFTINSDLRRDPVEELISCVKDFVKECIENCENESKNILLNNIVLTGGCANIEEMVERINGLICEIYPPSKVRVVHENNFHTYLGAAVLGSLGSTRCLFIGKKDYEEFGSGIIDRKSFIWS
ncbi:hypothetical protein GVAV_003124 [Gurleya vavrai]